MPITERDLRNRFGGNRIKREGVQQSTVYEPADVFTYSKTYCSQCGGEFGPGNSGYSHCEDHQALRIHQAAEAVPPQFRASPTVREAFSALLVALADNPPANIIGEADAQDMDERAEHVQALLGAVETYLTATLADAKHHTSGLKFDVNVLGILSDTRGDLVGTFRIAAEQMREMEREFDFDDEG